MEEKETKLLPNGPFGTRKTYEGKNDFDKYYLEVTEKEVFKESGEVDPDTKDKLGTIEKKLIVKKVKIAEFLDAQAETVGIAAYVRQLAVQGVDVNECSTNVDDKVQDFSMMPDNLADTLMVGDKAKEAFANMDPALKGKHTTIEGFLNSLSPEMLQDYIKSRIPQPEKSPEEGKGGQE